MDKRVGCSQVYSDIQRKKTQKPIEGIESQFGMLLLRFPAQYYTMGLNLTIFRLVAGLGRLALRK
jgi:hypothetical protein